MNCNRAQRLLELLAGGDLTAGEERDVRRHLEGCPTCRKRYESARRARRALEVLRFEEMAREVPETEEEGFWDDLGDTVMERLRREETATVSAAPLLWFGSGFAAAASLLLLVWLFFLQGGGESPAPAEELVRGDSLERVEGPLAGGRARLDAPRIIVPAGLEGKWPFPYRELKVREGWPEGSEKVVPVGGSREDL